ncbi:MAG: hypothetical protein EON52_07000, partial [Actinomycetales bacterium]
MNDDQQRPHDDGAEDDATAQPGPDDALVEGGLVEESDELDLDECVVGAGLRGGVVLGTVVVRSLL